MTDHPEVDIVIPVYNEESNLPKLIRDWRHLFNQIAVRHRFLFIDDGSTDGSLSLLQSSSNNSPVSAIPHHPCCRNKGE